jgi:hypothetical protein
MAFDRVDQDDLEPALHKSALFAALDADLHLERIGGGNETEVYCTDDRRYVVKVKGDDRLIGDVRQLDQAFIQAQRLRRTARLYGRIVGRRHRIINHLIIAQDEQGSIKPLVIQPYHQAATPLFAVGYERFNRKERLRIAYQLLHLIYRAITAFLRGGAMPDLYGQRSANKDERQRNRSWWRLPWRLWSFLVERNLLRSNNLLLSRDRSPRVILVDYDPILHGKLYQLVYYNVRLLLFVRDLVLIAWMALTGHAPKAS